MRTDRKIEIVLYPDSESYVCNDVIVKAQSLFEEWAYIVHDCDSDLDGNPKKTHIHLIGRNQSNMTPSGICYHLGVKESSLANIRSWRAAVRYLIHADQGDKHQYPIESVHSNFNVSSYFALKEDDNVQAIKIFDYIQNNQPSLSQCITFVLNNNLWSAFRRGFAVWAKLINTYELKECNKNYESRWNPQN